MERKDQDQHENQEHRRRARGKGTDPDMAKREGHRCHNQRFVDLTATVEAAGESGALSNAAYNRAQNAADEILKAYFEQRTEDAVQQLHKGFGDASTPLIDMSKVTLGKVTVSGCVVVALVAVGSVMVIALLVAMS